MEKEKTDILSENTDTDNIKEPLDKEKTINIKAEKEKAEKRKAKSGDSAESSEEKIKKKRKKKKKTDGEMGNIESRSSKEIISDFSPEPIKIPNYNVEKENKKHKNKQKSAKELVKINKRRKKIKKVLSLLCGIIFFVMTVCVIAAVASSVLVRINITEYSVERAINNYGIENIQIGKINDREALNLKASSDRASIIDILRDNIIVSEDSKNIITYTDIKHQVQHSQYTKFIAKNTSAILNYLMYGKKYQGFSGESVAAAIEKSSSQITGITGRQIGSSNCQDFADYVNESKAFKDISPKSVAKQRMVKYTDISKNLLSNRVLFGLLLLYVVLLILSVIVCNGYAHTISGWSFILSGAALCTGGFFYRADFPSKNVFIKCVVEALEKNFRADVMICGGAALVIGFLTLVIGHAMSDSYDIEEIEDNYEDI